jgi:hypothetical protein
MVAPDMRNGFDNHSETLGLMFLGNWQAKRRHAGGRIRHAGEPEPVSTRILGQEVAELLAQAQVNCDELAAYRDQEAFIISIHGTQLRLIAAHFTSAFLAALNTSFLPAKEVLRVRRSRAFEMKLVEDRIAALKMLIGLFKYVLSGTAEIGVCQALYEALRHA